MAVSQIILLYPDIDLQSSSHTPLTMQKISFVEMSSFISFQALPAFKTLPESAFFGSLSNEYLFNTRRRFRGPLLASAFVEETVGKAWLCPLR